MGFIYISHNFTFSIHTDTRTHTHIVCNNIAVNPLRYIFIFDLASTDSAKTTARRDKKHFWDLVRLYYRNWYQDWGHCGVTNDLGSSPQPEGEARGLWWASHVVGDTTLTEIEVSISILSWCLKTYSIYADSGVYQQKTAHKTASNQPLWGSMVTDHCHSSFLSYILVTIVMSQWCMCH